MKPTKMLSGVLLCSLAIMVAGPAFGQKKIKDLKYPALNSMEIPSPEKVTLENGLTLYLLEDHTLPLVNLSARLNCGSYLVPAAKVGLAGITGDVMRTGGTEKMTGDEIDEALEAIGASVETSIGLTSGSASANALSEYAGTIVGLLADVLRRPVFAPDKIDLAKTEARAAISRRNDDPFGINIREFRKLIYGAQSPYARHTEYATLDAVSRDDLVAFHRQCIAPNTTQLAIWGDFKKTEMVELIKQAFGDWARGSTDVPRPPAVEYEFRPTVNYALKTDVNQSNIFIGHIGGQMGDPDYPATIVMNAILGGSFSSRLFNHVRTAEGLAYAVSGTYTFRFDAPGFFYVFCSTKSGTTVKAVEECVKQIRGMQTDPPTADEMKLAKEGYLNSFVFNFDTKSEVINRMMTYDYYGFPADYLQTIKEAVEKVTPEDVIEVAKRKLNPDAVQIMVTGNAAEFGRPLSELGAVNEVDIAIPSPAEESFVATDEQLAQGQDLLHKSVAACGGVANFRKIGTVQRTAKVTVNMPQGAMSMEVATLRVYPDKVHLTMKTPMGDQVIVYDGQSGWITMGGQSQPMPSAQLADMKADFGRDLIGVFQNSEAPDYEVAYAGEEDLGGHPALRLNFRSAANKQFALYLDPETHRPRGMRYTGQSMAGPSEMVEIYRDFMKVKGVWLPSYVDRDEGAMTMQFEVVKMELNGTYDQAAFARPESL